MEPVERIKEVRKKKPRWGYKRVHAKLRKEGFPVNHKRIERVRQDDGFTLPARSAVTRGTLRFRPSRCRFFS